MVMLDREREFIPLTFDGMFKGLFKKNINIERTLLAEVIENIFE